LAQTASREAPSWTSPCIVMAMCVSVRFSIFSL
jgi:hypothetical protein